MRQGPQKALTGSALASRVAQFGMRSFISRIQTGTLTIPASTASATATILTCNVANSILMPMGVSINSADSTGDSILIGVTLTNATTLTATRGKTSGVGAVTLPYALVEYVQGALRNVQYGSLATGASTSGTLTITAVNTTKAFVLSLGQSTTSVSGMTGQRFGRLALTNSTTVTGTLDAVNNSTTMQCVVVEFY